jgi:hypothetical protein
MARHFWDLVCVLLSEAQQANHVLDKDSTGMVRTWIVRIPNALEVVVLLFCDGSVSRRRPPGGIIMEPISTKPADALPLTVVWVSAKTETTCSFFDYSYIRQSNNT